MQRGSEPHQLEDDPMTKTTLRPKDYDALCSAISYCRCEGLHYSVGIHHDELTVWSAGSIDRQTLALYGPVS
jgi:hypothetical protein